MSDVMSDFIDSPRELYPKKPKTAAKTKIVAPKKVTNMNKEQFKKTKSAHRAEIAKIKATRAKLNQDIKKHKMLMKQAKLVYKLSKMKEATK